MASEKAIREAIAATIQTAAPLAVVLPREVLGVNSDDWLGILQSPADNQKIRGWTVTNASAVITEERNGAAEYELRFAIWQFHQYSTGSNTVNSEDTFAGERQAVIDAFVGNLPAPLEDHRPLEFLPIGIFQVGSKLVHIAQGIVIVRYVTGC